jgi:hypothetical protein
METIELVVRLMVPVGAIVLVAMAWPVLRSWKI